jgi:hypothetical protein
MTAMSQVVITIDGDVQVLNPNAQTVPPSQSAEPKLAYNIAEAAEVSSISIRRLREYIADGLLTARGNGSKVIILRTDLDTFLTRLPQWKPEV